MKSLYFIAQTSSKDNLLKKLNKDLCDYIDIIIKNIELTAILKIQKCYKNYIKNNFIPNLYDFLTLKY